MKKISLRTIIIFYSFIIFIIPLAVISIFSISIFSNNSIQEIKTKNTLLINNLYLRITDYLSTCPVPINMKEIEKFCIPLNDVKIGLFIIITDEFGNIIVKPDNLKFDKYWLSKLESMKKKSVDSSKIKIEDNNYFTFSKTISETGWMIFLMQDEDMALKPLNALRLLLVIVFSAGLVITICAIIAGFNIIFKPIIEISKQTSKIADGNYSVNLGLSIIRELDVLANNFSKMIENVFKREIDLTLSEMKYRKLVEESSNYFFKINRKLRFTFVSPSIQTLLGITDEEFLHNPEKYLISSKINLKALNIAKRVFQKKASYPPFLAEVVNSLGEKIVLEIQLDPIFESIEVNEAQGVAREVTAKYKAEIEVQYLKNYLFNIIESMPSALITIDVHGHITQFNSAALKFIDKKAGEVSGKLIWTLSEQFQDYEEYIQDVLDKREGVEFREEIRVGRKEMKYFNVSIFPLNWGDMEGMVIRIDDISKMERAEIQLRQAQKLETIGTMAGGLAHDFNNILGAIFGTLALIEHRTKNKKSISHEVLKDDLNIIKEALSRASNIIQQLMSLSKKQTVNKEIIDLNSEINQVVTICKTTFDKLVDIEVKYSKEPAWIEGSLSQISQMILNLLINAKDAIHENGKIEITVEKIISNFDLKKRYECCEGKEFWLLKVSDNGKGIPEENKELIFDPFFTTKSKAKGTGLGLTMVFNIVKQHNGFIDFDSEIDKGTTFRIYIPAKEIGHDYVEKVTHKNGTIVSGTGLILIVDDEEYVRYTAKEILKECGYDVLLAADGDEGIKVFKENQKNIQGVVLDMSMPEKSGKETYIELKKMDSNVKVLLTSGLKTDPRITETMSLGVKYFLQKPYTLFELSTAVSELLKGEID
jgi:PAS domain S-box-containing protein